jgi:hypothetical protein
VDHGAAALPAALGALEGLELAAGMLCAVGAAALDREDAVRGVILSFVAAATALTAAEAAAWHGAGDARAAAGAALRAAALGVLGLGLAAWERRLVPALFAAAAAYTAAVAAGDMLYGESAGGALAGALGRGYCAVGFGLAASALGVRWAVMRGARRLVHADAARYEALWAAVLAGEDAERWLGEIREQVRRRARRGGGKGGSFPVPGNLEWREIERIGFRLARGDPQGRRGRSTRSSALLGGLAVSLSGY